MAVETHHVELNTDGDCEVLDLTPHVLRKIASGSIQNGIVTVFVIGSTAGVSTTEFEPGLVNSDLREGMERIAPQDAKYLHEETWHDDNGHAHVRATVVGPSLTVPLVKGNLTLGTWQQIILMDFDTRSRQRRVVVQVLGE